jgi:hypothetical protein
MTVKWDIFFLGRSLGGRSNVTAPVPGFKLDLGGGGGVGGVVGGWVPSLTSANNRISLVPWLRSI